MQTSRACKIIMLSYVSWALLSCGQQEVESPIAKAISLKVTSSPVVLPTPLDNELGQTCVESGIEGPRVRLRATLVWAGIGGATDHLVPLTMSLILDEGGSMGSQTYTSTMGSNGDFESVSFLFDVSTDYIAPDGLTHASDDCFLDYGGLPKPSIPLTGNTQLYVNATVRMMGVVRNGDEETPFVKEVRTKVLYVPGSIPSEQ